MGGLTVAFGIVEAALGADQEAINVSANNVGNTGTPGYTREVANWQESSPVTIGSQSYGTGATVSSVTSQRDRVLEERLQQQIQAQSSADAMQSGLTSVQSIFNQISSANGTGGIGGALNGFFSSISELEANPSDLSVRETVLSSAQGLAASFNSAASQLTSQATALNQQVGTTVQQVNALTSAIASLNQQIESVSPHTDGGTLEDQRQQDLQQLSGLIGFNSIKTENNGLTLTTGNGSVLLAGGTSYALSASTSGSAAAVYSGKTDITSSITGGSLGGTLQVLTGSIPATSNALDQLANSLATSINTVQQGGADLNGNPGTALFTLPSSVAGSAAGISVAFSDPALIAAAQAGSGPGSNANAILLANVANAPVVNGATPSDAYAQMQATIGSSLQQVQTNAVALNASVTQLQTQRNSLSAVSQDEEAANLQTLERSYQAASKVFSILDSLVATALNLGVPGVPTQ